ncbi:MULTISPECIES: WGR domain-containing protein [Planktothricoides]|uniref:WGR domain-containing protein n=1 Tax=Planktothricoides raciborskii FACHB-1370 TaxID=2949576 RepID=A0ABR8EG73_9CYAN|nr:MULTISPECIES: WGR domain-containing protein [Planktothricoides]KOR38526.1 molybdenum metabolism regulator [Planktothricoides sp. SR001]MBD2545437.1 WGR domain-containing protein [Planktothricoides raciborskii FACHB-1370]MBD2583665.1 WGR domain-containing protein [Planktothricoides raciborskii FACHB-1261]
MTEEITYLELSEEQGVSHKFYEITIKETQVIIRYGRIGDQGRIQTSDYPTPEKAKAAADKKIKEKLSKGYERAVKGVRQKRSVTRRETTSSQSTARSAPVLWKFDSGAVAFGIFISEFACWVGNQEGRVFALDFQGQVINQFQLPDGVKCLVADDVWFYAGCDDGNVYDLSGKIPRLAYEIEENVDIFWLDIYDGLLAVSDAQGQVALFHPEDEFHWTRLSQGKYGWMVRCDRNGVYHGHSQGVTCYDLEAGRVQWHQNTEGSVLFGWQEAESVYGGTARHFVYEFSKQGENRAQCKCDAAVYSCATDFQGNYIFAGDNCSSIYCFDRSGKRLWKLATGCGSALSMQWRNQRLYLVTTSGYLACIDVSETAIQSAREGNLPQTAKLQAPKQPGTTVSNALETIALEHISEATEGVVVRCIREGEKLRVRAISSGYNPDWNVQFPRNIREEGARYLVAELRESDRGQFYRAYGEIKKLVD